MRRFLSNVLLVASLALLFLPSPIAAQRRNESNKTRDVTGVVTGEDGKPIPGAVVQLKNTKSLYIISFITKEQGDYYFHGLSPDIDFEISASFASKMSPTRTLSSFDSRKQAVLNLKLDRNRP